jgi:hypothetical protein
VRPLHHAGPSFERSRRGASRADYVMAPRLPRAHPWGNFRNFRWQLGRTERRGEGMAPKVRCYLAIRMAADERCGMLEDLFEGSRGREAEKKRFDGAGRSGDDGPAEDQRSPNRDPEDEPSSRASSREET